MAKMVVCSYCNEPAKLVTGDVIYPHRTDLAHLNFWHCADCDAWVGTHKNSRKNKPLGTLANKELRRWRGKAHAEFDPIWKDGLMSRTAAYTQLATLMDLRYDECHIALFDVAQCRQAITKASYIKFAQSIRNKGVD